MGVLSLALALMCSLGRFPNYFYSHSASQPVCFAAAYAQNTLLSGAGRILTTADMQSLTLACTPAHPHMHASARALNE